MPITHNIPAVIEHLQMLGATARSMQAFERYTAILNANLKRVALESILPECNTTAEVDRATRFCENFESEIGNRVAMFAIKVVDKESQFSAQELKADIEAWVRAGYARRDAGLPDDPTKGKVLEDPRDADMEATVGRVVGIFGRAFQGSAAGEDAKIRDKYQPFIDAFRNAVMEASGDKWAATIMAAWLTYAMEQLKLIAEAELLRLTNFYTNLPRL